MKKTRLAVFASGSGSNYEAIAQACADGRIDAEVVLLVCDKPGAKVLERAERFGTESFAFSQNAPYPIFQISFIRVTDMSSLHSAKQ